MVTKINQFVRILITSFGTVFGIAYMFLGAATLSLPMTLMGMIFIMIASFSLLYRKTQPKESK